VQQRRAVAAAPIEAPAEITPESGFETMASSDVADLAGFEYGVSGGIDGGITGGFENAPPPPPPVATPRAPVRVGGEITAPRLLHRVAPVYPLLAQQAFVQGVVVLEATVDRGGRVDDIRVLRSHSLLDDAAIAAVREWVYEPLMLNGQPQPFVLTVTLSFSLPTTR
jgi:protein TonB